MFYFDTTLLRGNRSNPAVVYNPGYSAIHAGSSGLLRFPRNDGGFPNDGDPAAGRRQRRQHIPILNYAKKRANRANRLQTLTYQRVAGFLKTCQSFDKRANRANRWRKPHYQATASGGIRRRKEGLRKALFYNN